MVSIGHIRTSGIELAIAILCPVGSFRPPEIVNDRIAPHGHFVAAELGHQHFAFLRFVRVERPGHGLPAPEASEQKSPNRQDSCKKKISFHESKKISSNGLSGKYPAYGFHRQNCSFRFMPELASDPENDCFGKHKRIAVLA